MEHIYSIIINIIDDVKNRQVMIIYLMLLALFVGKIKPLLGPMVLGSDSCGGDSDFIGQMDSVSVLGIVYCVPRGKLFRFIYRFHTNLSNF